MKKLAFLIVSMMLLLMPSCDPIEYDMFGTIEGTVVDYDTHETLDGVFVQLSPGSKNCTTTSDGKFAFSELDAQQYSVTVQKNDYETNIVTVRVIPSETSQVSIRMKKKGY